jgi:hypothetical protein
MTSLITPTIGGVAGGLTALATGLPLANFEKTNS